MKILKNIIDWFNSKKADQQIKQDWENWYEWWGKDQKSRAQKVINEIKGKNEHDKYIKRLEEYIKQEVDLRYVLDAEFANIYKKLDAIKKAKK